MDATVDFFMDGGTGSRSSSRSKTLENLHGITQFLIKENSDFNLIQEIDVKSTRSYKVNEYAYMIEEMRSFASAFAYNYKVLWVPVPITKPHGNVNSGLLTLSKFKISASTRHDYPGKESFLRQLADLDRCLISSRIPVDNGRELVLINSHLSAYDKGGRIRKQQLQFLKNYIETEYKRGNYVIVGGDWNHMLPGTDPSKFTTTESWPDWLQKLPVDFKPEGFKWGADATIPSNRAVAAPYKKGQNFLSVIDGFLVSPNVEINKIVGHSLDFKYTDHNPVTGYFLLK
jgi:endonuclease/exonuclease/phosphatase family metal-dependent hydrolase